ncbi:nucleolar complex protein 2 homolog [Episyrphus balteatus]|uniref:nucleolar complex protein 2 homolog n=1 Tax=Episyrphus balteatus TaxID=286459 RepID=UPI002486784E|nr:nucleolar complex protein 2 homolog [Episyrphus balteatus]
MLKMKVKSTNKVKSLKEKKVKKTKLKETLEKVEKPKKKAKKIPQDVEPVEEELPVKSVKKIKDKKTKKSKSKTKSHMEQLEGLKSLDPEFYKFLKDNDKELLEFNMLDSDDDDEDADVDSKKKDDKGLDSAGESDNDDDGEDDDKFHKPSADLEVASDESDAEEEIETAPDGTQKITLNLLRQWQLQLQKPHVPIDVVRKVVQAFSSALASVSGDDSKIAAFRVEGAAAFNGVVQLCVLNMHPAVVNVLGISEKTKTPLHKMKKWPKVRSCLRYYLMDLVRLIEHVSSANILTVLLKHLHQMAGMIGSFSNIGKTTLKRLIVLWSTADETVRVLAFLCILKITRNQQSTMLNHVLKAMYMSYVRNSKFVSPTTLPSINFMRRSLVEMFALDLNTAYQHAFLYIRQLAIHLRNAVILKKKDSFQSVYNWQYVNSIRLWVDLLGATHNKPQLQPLIYPLVSIVTGAIKLIPTAQYFPLRFHCINSLISLSKQTDTFIPVLPFILEVLNSTTFNKKHSAVSMKPMQFTCILRLNKSQMAENGFRDEVVENVCGLLLDYLAHESATLAFPDLVVPTVVTLKQYLKKCKNSNYSRKLKQVLDKIVDNAKFIENERRKINFGLKDTSLVQSWETKIRNSGTPLGIYYTSWVKTHETKKRRQAAETDDINDYDVPMIKRQKIDKKTGNDGEVELFPSDSEDEGLNNILKDEEDGPKVEVKKQPKQKKEKKLKKQKEIPAPVVEDEEDDGADAAIDIVKDLDMDDW